jgi:hypothetical protein
LKFRRARVSRPLLHPLHTTTTPHGVAMRSRSRQNPDIDSTRTSGEAKKEKDKDGHEVLLSRNTEAVRNSEHILSLDGDVILRRHKRTQNG